MAGLMGSSFPLSLMAGFRTSKQLDAQAFTTSFKGLHLTFLIFFSTIVKLCPPVSKWHDFVSKSKRAEEHISACPYGLWADLTAFYACR